MREPRLARAFVLRSDVIPDIYRHDGRFVILVNDERQSVRQNELLKWNIDVLGQNRQAAEQ
jgi:hypothetical protein